MSRLGLSLRSTLSWLTLSLILATDLPACGPAKQASEPAWLTAEAILSHLSTAERTAEVFLGHLKDHEYERAHRQLTDPAASGVTARQLQRRVDAAEAGRGVISGWSRLGNALSVRAGSVTQAKFCYSLHHSQQQSAIVRLELRPVENASWLISNVRFVDSQSLSEIDTGACYLAVPTAE